MYQGGTAMVGFGVSIPAEMHGEIMFSKILFDFNIFEEFDQLYEHVMQW